MKNIKRYVVQPANIVLFRKGRQVTEHEIDTFFVDPKFEHLRDMHIYSLFSHAVYCEILNGYAQDESVKLYFPENWRSVENLPVIPDSKDAVDLKGLRYHGWINMEEKKAVIAFRGTRFTKFADWYSNFNFITRFIPKIRNHYARTEDLLPLFIDAIHTQYGMDIKIVATGHSLGGGLAQYAAYLSPHINTVFAFAPSPVTGYRSINKTLRTKNKKHNKFARIFEHGEILAYLRFFLRKIVNISIKDPEINEVRFNFSESDAFSEHSMGQLAEHILSQSPHADYDETYQQIA